MVISEFLSAGMLLFILVCLSQTNALIDCQTRSSCSDRVAFELEEAKLRILRLESILEQKIGEVNAKSEYLHEYERKVEDLEVETNRLKAALLRIGDDASHADQKIDALDEEIQVLWAASRKNNFEIHALECKASDAERALQEITDQIESMAEIVSEQWIQIRQLEQAVHMAEIRTSKFKRESGWRRCPTVKSSTILLGKSFEKLEEIFSHYAPAEGSVSAFLNSQPWQLLSAAKHFHHQLQGCIKQAMKGNGFTAILAQEELVFILASVLVAFPIMSSCMLLLSHFS